MLIFKDVITDDEMISDSYDLKEIDGIVYEADCAMIEEGGVTVGELHKWLPNHRGKGRPADDITLQTLVPTPPPKRLRRPPMTRSSRSTTSLPPSVSSPPRSTRRAIWPTLRVRNNSHIP